MGIISFICQLKTITSVFFFLKNEVRDRGFSNNILLLVLFSLIEFFFIQIFIFRFGAHDFSVTCLLPKTLCMI